MMGSGSHAHEDGDGAAADGHAPSPPRVHAMELVSGEGGSAVSTTSRVAHSRHRSRGRIMGVFMYLLFGLTTRRRHSPSHPQGSIEHGFRRGTEEDSP